MTRLSEHVHTFILQVCKHSAELHSLIVSVVSFHPLLLAMVATVFVAQQEAPLRPEVLENVLSPKFFLSDAL